MRPTDKNTRLGDPKRVFGNDMSKRLADLANVDVLLIFVHLGKIDFREPLRADHAQAFREVDAVFKALPLRFELADVGFQNFVPFQATD